MSSIVLTSEQSIRAMILIVTHETRQSKGAFVATLGAGIIERDVKMYVSRYYPAGLRLAVEVGSTMHATLVKAGTLQP